MPWYSGANSSILTFGSTKSTKGESTGWVVACPPSPESPPSPLVAGGVATVVVGTSPVPPPK